MRTFLSSERAPWGVLDNWLNQGHPLAVFTVLVDHATGEGWLAEVKGDRQVFGGWPLWIGWRGSQPTGCARCCVRASGGRWRG